MSLISPGISLAMNRSIYQRETGINSPGITLAKTRAIYPDASTYSNLFIPSSMAAARPEASLIRRSPQSSGFTRAGVIPASTLVPRATSTGSVFGGVSGGVGPATALPTTPLGPSMLTNFSSSVGKAGTGIMNTLGTLIPLAIKVVLAVIVIKIVLWLVKGRRR